MAAHYLEKILSTACYRSCLDELCLGRQIIVQVLRGLLFVGCPNIKIRVINRVCHCQSFKGYVRRLTFMPAVRRGIR